MCRTDLLRLSLLLSAALLLIADWGALQAEEKTSVSENTPKNVSSVTEKVTSKQNENDLRLRIDAFPHFVFDDDEIKLMLKVYRDREPPKKIKKKQEQLFRIAYVRLNVLHESIPAEVEVPPHNDHSAMAHFSIDFTRLRHKATLAFRAGWNEKESATDTTSEIVILHVTDDPENVQIRDGHFEDATGRRVIFTIPRPNPSGHRRWLPLHATMELSQETPTETLMISNGGKAAGYAKPFLESLPYATRTLVSATKGSIPIFRTLLAAFSVRDRAADLVIIDPGIGDVLAGTPAEDVYMALHACAAIFDNRAEQPRRIYLATPYPSGEPHRTKGYSKWIHRVARERHLVLADLTRSFKPTAGLSQMQPSQLEAESIQQALRRTVMHNRIWLAAVLPITMFFFLSGALFWLFVFARQRTS